MDIVVLASVSIACVILSLLVKILMYWMMHRQFWNASERLCSATAPRNTMTSRQGTLPTFFSQPSDVTNVDRWSQSSVTSGRYSNSKSQPERSTEVIADVIRASSTESQSSVKEQASDFPVTEISKRRHDILSAIDSGDSDDLKNALQWAKFDGCEKFLQDEIELGKDMIRQKHNLERVRGSIRNMRPGLISELRSYSKPPNVICDVMACVYLLLGERDEDKLKNWSSIQAMMCQTGSRSLKRLIETRQVTDIPVDVIEKVKGHLSKYDFQSIYLASEGGAAFYVWILDTIREFEQT
ncbi:uncharacterized protein LOC143460016 isoform X1 [Clavelina lepadiformis]|uniref:Uncharacterized protein n=1 Tax=Clavelina lepadiformis TaxID=159417 RepID=A0ABP0FMC5_CLALP